MANSMAPGMSADIGGMPKKRGRPAGKTGKKVMVPVAKKGGKGKKKMFGT